MAPAACSACAMPPRRRFWSACDDRTEKISAPAAESGDKTVLGCGCARQIPDQALHRLRRAALLSALDLSVLLLRQDGVGGKFGRGDDLYLQPDAQIGNGTLRDRLCHAEGRSVAANQFCRLRSDETQHRPEGKSRFQTH